MWNKIKKYIYSFLVGVIISTGIWIWINYSTSTKLDAELRSTKWSLESATRTNTELAKSILQLSNELKNANKLADINQSIINNQQSIINGITQTITNGDKDIGEQIQAIADGFRQLYYIYNKSTE